MDKSFKTFLVLWVTQGLSALGSSITYFIIVFWLTDSLFPDPSHQSSLAFALTALSLIMFIPRIIVSPLAGVWVDKYDRKKIMLYADFLQVLICFLLIFSFVFFSGDMLLWIVFLLIGLMSLFGIMHEIAFSSSYILIVPEKHLARANAMMQTLWTVSGVLAPVLAATIFSLGSATKFFPLSNAVPLAIGLDAITFLISGVCLFFLKIASPNQKQDIKLSRQSFWGDLREGTRYLFQYPALLWLAGLGFITNIIYSVEILLPILVKDSLSQDWIAKGWNFSFSFAFMDTAGFIGGTIAGVFMIWWGGIRSKKIWGVLLPLIVSGFMIMLLGLSSSIYISSTLIFIRMFVSVISKSHEATIWQKEIPTEIQGRVFGLKSFLFSLAVPLGTLIVGIFGANIEPNMIFLFFGSVFCLVTITQIFNKKLVNVERE